MESLRSLLAKIKELPNWARIATIIAGVILAVVSLWSCSHSYMRFQGAGEVEYEYQGKYGPAPPRGDAR